MPDQSERPAEVDNAEPCDPNAGDPNDGDALSCEESRAIGEPIRPILDELVQLTATCRSLMKGQRTARLEQIHRDLDGLACRVAVVGQVKAGKSSLVNALIRRPGLSPVSVNPWTAVVSRLHFGRASEDGGKAVFRFFDEDDWCALSTGGPLQAISERLGLPAEEETFSTQVALVRARAERRLGRLFTHLLGRSHSFAKVTADIIERYICAGHDLDADSDVDRGKRHEASMVGRFADITKSADLFFDLPPFAVPTVVIDTPGTNDPFLVRDGLTREILDGADVYVVVLTAQQALSTADLAMLRLLQGLHKDRMVVFVNRIDMLADPARDARRVVSHVRRRLALEFPNVDIPVMAGSAVWAEALLSDDGPSLSADVMPTLRAHARHNGLGEEETATPDAVIAAASGLPLLSKAISAKMRCGPMMLGLQRAASALQALMTGLEATSAHDERTLAEGLTAATRREASIDDRTEALDLEIQALEGLPAALGEGVETLEQDLAMTVEEAVLLQQVKLDAIVQRFAEKACSDLRQAMSKGGAVKVWAWDTQAIRRDLERTFLDHFRQAIDRFSEIEHQALARLRQALAPYSLDETVAFGAGRERTVDPVPSISVLGQRVAIDVGDQWARWWRRWRGADQQIQRLEEVVLAEFQPVVGGLVMSAKTELEQEASALVERFSLLNEGLTEAIAQRRTRLAGLRADVSAKTDNRRSGGLIRRYRAKSRKNQERLDLFRSIDAALFEVTEQCAALAPAGPGAASTAEPRCAQATPSQMA